jgi:hypothetical protein
VLNEEGLLFRKIKVLFTITPAAGSAAAAKNLLQNAVKDAIIA